MKPDILIIADSDPRKKIFGGVAIYSYNLTKYLTKNGYRVIFIGKKQNGKKIYKFINFRFVEVNKKPNQSNYVFLKNLFKIANQIKLDENTIIHAQRPDWLVPFTKHQNKKIVTLHGSHTKNVYLKKGAIIGKIYSKLEEIGLEAADIIISVSEENTEYYKGLYNKRTGITKKFRTIPVGIDTSIFRGINKAKARKKYGFKKRDKIVVYVGRIETEKNLRLLMGASHKANAKLFIVGNGREERAIKKYAARLGSNVIFHDSVTHEHVPEILSCGDIFALTSLYEGLPTIVIEALSAGLPVISTNVGDVDKLVINGKTGYIVDENDIVKKLKLLIKNPHKYRKNCIAKAKEFSWNKVGLQIIKNYQNLSKNGK